MREIFICILFATFGMARPSFNAEYDHQNGNSVPTISSIVAEQDGEIVLNRNIPVGEKTRVSVYGEHLNKVGKIIIATDHNCHNAVKTPGFSLLAASQLYFETTLDEYDTTYYVCLSAKKKEVPNYSFTVGNEMDQLLQTEDAPFYRKKWFKCYLAGGVPCLLWF